MTQTSVVVVGGSRGSLEVGYGSYAIIIGHRKQVTHVEFGGRMSVSEALYDTLIMALHALVRQGNVSTTRLEVQSPIAEFVSALQANRPPQGLTNRHKRLAHLLTQFQSWDVTSIPPGDAQRQIAG